MPLETGSESHDLYAGGQAAARPNEFEGSFLYEASLIYSNGVFLRPRRNLDANAICFHPLVLGAMPGHIPTPSGQVAGFGLRAGFQTP